MSKPPDFPAASKQPGAFRAEAWHDLVATVVAVKGSPRVRPPAALLKGVERRLGFEAKPALWWRTSRFLGGMAAAASVALALGWLAWRAWRGDSPRESVASAGRAPAAVVSGLAGIEAQNSGEIPPGPDAPRAKPAGASLASGGIAAPSALSIPAQKSTGAPRPASSREGGVAWAGDSRVGSLFSNAETTAMPDPGIREMTDLLYLKSDFYVVGIIAAALQSPVTDNPYDFTVQPEEWSDWMSGYELGGQLPPSEAFALGDSWDWRDPGNRSLASGIAGDDIGGDVIGSGGIVASVTTRTPVPPAPSETKEGNSAASSVGGIQMGVAPPKPIGAAEVSKGNGIIKSGGE